MHTNGQVQSNGAAGEPRRPSARAARRLAGARLAARDLRTDAGTWLQLRGERLADAARRATWSVVGWLLLAFVLFVTIGTATVLLLVGAAVAIGQMSGTGVAGGALVVGAAGLASVAARIALGRRTRTRDDAAAAERRLRASMRASASRLVRGIGTVPLLLLAGAGGLVSVGMLRDRRVRRFVLVAASTLRTAGRVARRAAG